jgi:two-component system CheB/CheR fusion protein
MPVDAANVYVIRPGHTLTIKDGKLHLGESLAKPGHNRPVDDFFRSLAEEQRERRSASSCRAWAATDRPGPSTSKP